jgi:hypothetical protein
MVHGGPASGLLLDCFGLGGVAGRPDPESDVDVEVEVGPGAAAPASGASLAGGWGGPFAPQYAVASTTTAAATRSIRTEWRR